MTDNTIATSCRPGLTRRLANMVYDLLLLLSLLFIGTFVVLLFTGGKSVLPGTPFFRLYQLYLLYCFVFFGR